MPIRQALNKIYRMPVEFYKEFDSLCLKRVIKRKDFLLSKDQYCEHAYFLHSGVLRIFKYDAGQPVNVWIIIPGQVVHLPKRFFNEAGKIAVYIQALSECVISSVSLEQLKHLKGKFPDVQSLCEKTSEVFESSYENYLRMLTKDGESRYEYITHHFPTLRENTYIDIVASFMNMSKSTYYRCLKKEMKSGY